ncbi:MarR family winged helix-turn-helix transcriptional regulator [Cupriavidus sp. MP-37]|uniref:MarR family winged helix-turn-helix transcriptional regulator n=1 Tax=Cupriavidus sp. MP-37 TaxID=2884455 RepID=UPI001D0B1EB5|nr:MarR family transcriptional regulator [Cupriavidus sp. MP-37]UDM51998.1 MarR family transcriptional regulator [Cupriavidus sp. MP-37]
MTDSDPSYDQSVSSVHNRLFFRLFQAGNTLDRQTIKYLGITTVQWSVLGALTRPQAAQGMSFSELAEYLVVSRQSLDGVLKRLERDEHVVRVADTVDRRAKNVMLTPKGRAFWSSLQPKIYEFYRQALVSFRFDDKVSLVHFLNQLNGGMAAVHLDSVGDVAVQDAEAAQPLEKKTSSRIL